MRLQQLSNLIDAYAGDHFDPQNRWNEEVVFMAPDSAMYEILSMSWSTEDEKWVLCVDLLNEEYDD